MNPSDEVDREVHSIWYRSILDDGTVWCESRDLKEVIRMTQGKDAIIQESVAYIVYGKWNSIMDMFA